MSHLFDDCDARIDQSLKTVRFSRSHKILISCVVVFYFATVAIWNLPTSDLKGSLMNLLRIPVSFFSVAQVWNMFGTGARPWHQFMAANITFADGSTKFYELPRMETMSLSERYRREKLRKIFVDTLPSTDYSEYWPDICVSLARANADPKNEPVLITLFLKVGEIPAPDRNKIAGRGELPRQLHSDTLIVYRVKESDLLQP